MNLETKITIYKFTPQLFTLTRFKNSPIIRAQLDANNLLSLLWVTCLSKNKDTKIKV